MAKERIINRYDTKYNWERYNPILAPGELCVEIDSGLLKVGRGARWMDTIYFSGPGTPSAPPEEPEDPEVPPGTPVGNHEDLPLGGRSGPGQHTIGSIIDLERKVNVHVGVDEPVRAADTWIKIINKISDPVPVADDWTLLVSTPLIRQDHMISPPPEANFNDNLPVKLVVVGTISGEPFVQELHSDIHKYIRGEVIILMDDEPTHTISVDVELLMADNNIYVVGFTNTGAVNISEFTALKLEVYV